MVDVNELANQFKTALKDQKVAIEHLFNGDFENWLKTIGDLESANFAELTRRNRFNLMQFEYGRPLSDYDLLTNFITFYNSDDPLLRSMLYMKSFRGNTDFIVDKEFAERQAPFLLEYSIISRIARDVSKKELITFLTKFEQRNSSVEKDTQNIDEEVFQLNTGLLKKKIEIRGKELRHLLPKLRTLLSSADLKK